MPIRFEERKDTHTPSLQIRIGSVSYNQIWGLDAVVDRWEMAYNKDPLYVIRRANDIVHHIKRECPIWREEVELAHKRLNQIRKGIRPKSSRWIGVTQTGWSDNEFNFLSEMLLQRVHTRIVHSLTHWND
jgi:hypothetical protein